jgi:Ethanolamine utilization protein EutJ (predicted chaperonin)
MSSVQNIIQCNKKINQMPELQKHISTAFGVSLVALTMIDKNCPGIVMSIEFANMVDLDSFVDGLVGIWDKYAPIRTAIRSYKREGEFLEEEFGRNLSDTTSKPSSIAEYKKHGVKYDFLIDIHREDETFKITFHKWDENESRMLTLRNQELS